MKKLSYDCKFNRLNYTPDDGVETIKWDISGNALKCLRDLISVLEGTDMGIVYTEKPEKHMANYAIELLQSMRRVLLTAEKVSMISSGNKDVANLIEAADEDDLIGDSGLTKAEYLEISGAIARLITWSETDITLSDGRVVKPREIIMKGYEV